MGGQISIGNAVASRARISSSGKHRTEVTEVTEGDRGFVGESSSGDEAASVRELAQGESIARRSQRSQRGIGVLWAEVLR
jgi:hypothetical protein